MRNASQHGGGPGRKPGPRLQPLAWSVAAALSVMAQASAGAAALPTGMQVVAGQAVATQSGSTLEVQTGQRTILNWNSFSIGAGNQVVFQQPGASSAVLNRVVGQDPSNILGELRSNGQVWLINPNGVLFGAGARVDVAGLVASTLDIDNRAFLAGGGLLAAAPAGSAAVVNEGSIRTPYGGQVLLVGSSVTNGGSIEVPGGRASLLAASQVQLADSNTPFMSFQVPSLAGLASQEGSVAAGDVDIYGAVVNQQGSVVATGTSHDAAGHIVLRSAGDTRLAAGSLTQAQGGSVDIASSQGAVNLGGSVDVSAASSGNGGSITVGAASIDVTSSGSLRADAAAVGNGGHIALRASDSNTVLGALSARGGEVSGNGGLIETSSSGALDLQTVPDASAPNGIAGEWLIDPYDVNIVSGSGTASNVGSGPSYTGTADPATIDPSVIESALNAGTNVTISTGGASPGTDEGDITVSSPISVSTPKSGATLTLNAFEYISIQSSITAASGNLAGPLNLKLTEGDYYYGEAFLDGSGQHISLNGGVLDLGHAWTGATHAYTRGMTLQNMTVTGQELDASGSTTLSGVTLSGINVKILEGSTALVPDSLALQNSAVVTVAGDPNAITPNPGSSLEFSGTSSYLNGSGTVYLMGQNDTLSATEPPRVWWRLQLLRRWSHEEVTEVQPRGSRARRAHDCRGPRRVPVAVGDDRIHRGQDRLHGADLVQLGAPARA